MQLTLKRLMDAVLAAALLVAFSPIMLVVLVAVRWRLGAPALFRQLRPGLGGKPFTLFKFRTMTESCAADGTLLPDVQRLTPWGAFLRGTSLDELPQLWNVLRGDMSFVGPRPLLLEYLERYTPEQARRMDVRPGITGWAQIRGRNAIDWDERLRLDVWYVDHRSWRLDIYILWITVGRVLRRDGVAAAGHATMPKFTGSGGTAPRQDAPPPHPAPALPRGLADNPQRRRIAA